MNTQPSILELENSPDGQRFVDAINTGYLYEGPAKAMKHVEKDLKALLKQILSGPHSDEDAQANIDRLDFLSLVVRELHLLPISKSDLTAVDKLKTSGFLVAERILQAYPFGDRRGYGKAASRFHSLLHAFQPDRTIEDSALGMHSKRARALEAALSVADAVSEVSGRVGAVLAPKKPNSLPPKRKTG